MEKRYQVFVSSTYVDLREERQQVIQALLELDCIPSGMELFPAADEDQWSLIKNIIDECDYYILIVGGRYGSTNDEGVSYTEMEYRYALETQKPIIAFLHKDPSKIEKGKCESTVEGQHKLDAFRDTAQKKMCKYWSSPQELGSVVSRSVINLQRKSPGIGWVRGDVVTDKEATHEILRLSKEIQRLETKLSEVRTQAPKGTELLAQGEETYSLRANMKAGRFIDMTDFSNDVVIIASWNDIFSALSPSMINEAISDVIKSRLEEFVGRELKIRDSAIKSFFQFQHKKISIYSEDFETVLVQIRALGLMTKSEKSRSIKDTGTYWTLTPYGNEFMTRLRAIPAEIPF